MRHHLNKDGLERETLGFPLSAITFPRLVDTTLYSNSTEITYTDTDVKYVYPNGDYDHLSITGELWSYTAETSEPKLIMPKAERVTKSVQDWNTYGRLESKVTFYYQDHEIRMIILKDDGTRIELYRDDRRKKIYQDGGWMWI